MSAEKARRSAFFLALILCVGHTIGDTHVHLDIHEESDCTVCAIAEPGFVLDIDKANNPASLWQLCYSLPTYPVILSPRLYTHDWSRAPPIS